MERGSGGEGEGGEGGGAMQSRQKKRDAMEEGSDAMEEERGRGEGRRGLFPVFPLYHSLVALHGGVGDFTIRQIVNAAAPGDAGEAVGSDGAAEKTAQRETRVAIASAGHGAAHEVVEEAGGEEGVEQNQGAAEAAGDIAGAGTACIDGAGDGGGDDARTGDQAGAP